MIPAPSHEFYSRPFIDLLAKDANDNNRSPMIELAVPRNVLPSGVEVLTQWC
jgi:hypothetical protein